MVIGSNPVGSTITGERNSIDGGMRANMNRLWVLLSCLLLAPCVSSQASPLPTVSLECESGPHEMEVYPGSDRVVQVNCIVSNDSVHTEQISISISSSGLATAAPSSVTLPPGSETEFQVSARGDEKMAPQTFNVSVSATVDTFSGAPCVTCEPETVDFLVETVQYADFSVSARTGTLQMDIGASSDVSFDIHNEGNAEDSFSVIIENKSGLEALGFSFSVNDTGQLSSGERLPYSLTVSASQDVSEVDVQVSVRFVSNFDDSFFETAEFILRSDGAPDPIISLGSDDTALIYGGISAAGLLITILIIFIAMRSIRRRKIVTFTDDFDDFSDLDDF